MADMSAIKLPNGTTYTLKDTAGRKEAYLEWGGKNITGDITPVGMSISMEHSANRIAFLNPAAIQIEYTTNGGSTWTDSGYTDTEKMWLCTSNQGIAIGQSRAAYSASTALTTNHWTRVTLTGQNGTTGYVYTSPRKLLINMSTALGVDCLIEYKTGVSGASWQTFGTYAVSGWSGWNDIPLILGTFGGGSNQTGNNWYLRFTFKITSTRTDNYKGMAQIYGLRLFGTSDWGSASSNNGKGPISSTGHLYSYDTSANATFPAKVTANGGFSGNLTGNVTGNVSGSAGSVAWTNVSGRPSIPTSAASKVTGITASTTATKTTLGTAFSIPNVTSVGSASNWVFEDVACDDITSWSAGSASTWAFTGVTAATGVINATVSGEASDTLTISLATTTVQSKSSGSNSTAPSLSYTAKTASHVKSGGNGTAPTLGTAFSVPNVTGNTSATVSITDPGHTHTLS